MKPKDKAKQLIDKYKDPLKNGSYYGMDYAKQCAFISVEEIKEEVVEFPFGDSPQDNKPILLRIKYWNEVVEEIKKL